MKSLLLTNKEMAKAYGGYDFITADMRRVCQAHLQKLADMGLGFYETDPNFPENNRFISLKEVLETE